ncbi:hypothetical protein [Dictyobacter formicarum]|uniref:YbaK/aminoacyl-tRNA synthetase-associated domain-containing protein n=1 Tax=Dictyobacter formicarum TaxID=2778368 RepID=A0ABQ3V9X1_9CHLR|nr:hypothetical protein [Dictyobacter formicarum]GHO82301.1 hypothetical protein KSZ_03070 [Dictyobacter formicarum]
METIMSIVQILRDEHYDHVLLLVDPKLKARVLEAWEHQSLDGHTLSEQFPATSLPQCAQETRICIASVFDIQTQIGVDMTQPFFTRFDAIILCDGPSTVHGPVWHQIVEIFTILDVRMLQVRSLVSEESA